jgi:bacterioferritin-associated ferredoxin
MGESWTTTGCAASGTDSIATSALDTTDVASGWINDNDKESVVRRCFLVTGSSVGESLDLGRRCGCCRRGAGDTIVRRVREFVVGLFKVRVILLLLGYATLMMLVQTLGQRGLLLT